MTQLDRLALCDEVFSAVKFNQKGHNVSRVDFQRLQGLPALNEKRADVVVITIRPAKGAIILTFGQKV